MKRNHYQIEGDTLIRVQSLMGMRLVSLNGEWKNKKLKQLTYFSTLPIEVIGYLLPFLANVHTLQEFARFLFQEYGISMAQHKAVYPQEQLELLTIFKNTLSTCYPTLFEECRRDRLERISYCTGLHERITDRPNLEAQFSSLKAICDAEHLEIFAFVNHFVCEHCTNRFASISYAIDQAIHNIRDPEDTGGPIPLCRLCGNEFYSDKTLKEKILDVEFLKRHPLLQYVWLTDAKVRTFCGIKKGIATKSLIQKYPHIRSRNKNNTRSLSKQVYLLKDILPYVEAKFIRKSV